MFQPAVTEQSCSYSLALQVHLFALGSTRLKLLPVFGNEMDNGLDNVFEEWLDFVVFLIVIAVMSFWSLTFLLVSFFH